ncbi:MAG TPA: metalloregulator ArsR/SmtB family transcription factor [Candidatus Limnocylindria bacterium]
MRRSSPRVRVDIGEAYELVLSLAVAAEGEVAALGAGDPLLARVRAFAASAWMWTHLASVVAESPVPRDVDAFRVTLERLPALEIQRRLVGYYTSWFRDMTDGQVMDLALRGDAAATRAFLRTSMPEDAVWHASLRRRLAAGERETKRELVDLIDTWDAEVFRAIGTRMPLVRAAARIRKRRVAGRSNAEVVGAFLGSEYVPAATTDRVIVVPSLVLRDEIHEFDHGRTLFLCVPVEQRARRDTSELTTILRALADDGRMQMVVALSREDLLAQDLADQLGLSLSTTLHHLAALRRAGLVEHGGRRRAYALRGAPLRRLRDVLAETLAPVSRARSAP